tara:strand:- start:699 stop:1346 length:648 start_codon:yes stop_codon:yes gene_type:complete
MSAKYIFFLHVFFSFLIISVNFLFTDYKNLYLYLIKEDGIIEYSTAFFLLFSSIYLIYIFNNNNNNQNNFGLLLFSIAFFFGFGEEISWGQRIFDMESPFFFTENNLQNETNIHNLMINGIEFNKWIFTYLSVFIFSIYFGFLPFLYKKIIFLRELFDKFSIVIPRYEQSLVFLISTIIIYTTNYVRVSEIWECLFALTIFSTCINPLNKRVIYN